MHATRLLALVASLLLSLNAVFLGENHALMQTELTGRFAIERKVSGISKNFGTKGHTKSKRNLTRISVFVAGKPH